MVGWSGGRGGKVVGQEGASVKDERMERRKREEREGKKK